MDMFDAREEKRSMERRYLEPHDSGIYLSLSLNGKDYKFTLLDVSPGGVGMLVKKGNEAILEKLHTGRLLDMEYDTPFATIPTKFKVRHITKIIRGTFKGHYQVGLLLISNPD